MSVKSTDQLKSTSSLINVKSKNSSKTLIKNNNSAIIKISEKPTKFSSEFQKTQSIIDASPEENRLLKSKKLCILRPELIANLDFKSIKDVSEFDFEDINTRMFLKRLAKRKIELESANLALETALKDKPLSFEKAKIQYEASIASAASEIALLKLAYNFKFYAEIGSSFSSFTNFYSFDFSSFYNGSSNPSKKGFNFEDFMKETMQWGSNSYFFEVLRNTISSGKDATMLLQFINDLSFSFAFSTPVYALAENRFGADNSANLNSIKSTIESPNTKILNIFSDKDVSFLNEDEVFCARFCRDITATIQLSKIFAAKGEENEKLKLAIEKYTENYFSLSNNSNPTLFKSVFGWDPFASSYSAQKVQSAEKYYYVPDFSSYKTGLVSKIFTLDEATVIISSDSDEYQESEKINKSIPTRAFSGVKSLVDKSFSSDSGVDLRLYNNTITQVQDNLKDSSYIFKQLFKLLDKKGSKKSKEPLASDTHPTSLQNLYAKTIKLVNKRYLKKFTKYLGYNASELLDSKESNITNSEEFYKCWGIHFIINYPEQSKNIIRHFIKDYNKGFLTFSENSKIEKKSVINSQGQAVEIEVETRENVYPGTQSPNDLKGLQASLYSYLQNLESEIRNSTQSDSPSKIDTSTNGDDYLVYSTPSNSFSLIQTASPTSVFCGSLETATLTLGQQQAGFFDLTKGDLVNSTAVNQLKAQTDARASLLFEWQQCACMWVKDSENNTFPAGIIPVAGSIIDAVMTIIFECLNEIIEIKPASKSSNFFPAVESNSPPYHKQTFDTATNMTHNIKYIGGLGSFDSINTQYWIPVLNTFNDSLTRDDKSMIFSGSSMEDVVSSIINAISIVCKKMKNKFGVSATSSNFASQFIANRSLSQQDKVQIPKFGSSIKLKDLEAKRAINSNSVLGISQNSIGLLQLERGLFNPYTEAILGDSGNFAKNNSPLYGQTLKVRNFNFSIPGIYLFANVKNPNSQLYKELFNSGNSFANTGATPSQLLDKVSSKVSKNISEDFINTVQDQITEFNNQGIATSLGAKNLIPFYTIRDTFLKAFQDVKNLDNLEESRNLYSVRNKILKVQEKYDSSILTQGQATDYINDLWKDMLSLIKISGDDAQIPQEIWILINLTGNASDSPIDQFTNSAINEIEDVKNSIASTASINKYYGDEWWMNDSNFGNNQLRLFYIYLADLVLNARDEDIRFSIAFDILDKFSERINKYSETAYDGLVGESDQPSALEKLLQDLSKTVPGKDVIQNLNRQQLSLKSASLKRLSGDTNNSYIPNSEILSENDIKAIKVLMNSQTLNGKEGKNTRCNVIGMPSGFFNNVYDKKSSYTGPLGTNLSSFSNVSGKYSPLIGIKTNCKLPDYPMLSVIPKVFRFDYELFVFSDAFESVDFNLINCWDDLVKNATFTRLRFLSQEGSPGSSEQIVKIDAEQKEIFKNLESNSNTESQYNSTLFDIYSNTLASYLLEKYYKIIVGMGLNEDSFSSISGGLKIPINDYAIDFNKALSSIYKDLSDNLDKSKIDEIFIPEKDITGLDFGVLTPGLKSSNNSIATYEKITKTFSKDISEGEFKNVDMALFESFSNASSSNLFSAKTMRDKMISAKYFDRVFYILIDPDEFKIASSKYYFNEIRANRISIGGYTIDTLNNLKNAYLSYQNYLIDNNLASVDSLSSNKEIKTLKLNQRIDEGKSSFSSTYFSVLRNQNLNAPYGVTLKEDNPGDLMIVDFIEIKDEKGDE
jgi:hypothetical protein